MKSVCMYDREDEYENNCGLSYMLGVMNVVRACLK